MCSDSLWHKFSPSPLIHLWLCAVCLRGRVASGWQFLLWAVRSTQDLERGMKRMTMRMMIWGIPANSCHEGLDKMWSLALCSAKERETTFLTRLKGQLQMNLGQFKSFTLCSGIYAEFLIISESKKKKKKCVLENLPWHIHWYLWHEDTEREQTCKM